MKRYFVGLCAGVVGLALSAGTASALSVTTSNDGATLVSTILGGGVTVSNIVYTGGASASGTFTDGLSSGIGIESGIILTSGNAAGAVGPNNNDAYTGNNGLAGDADLTALIPGFNTHDASVLEFDFTTASNDLFFNYVFGSDEYNEWVNSAFNDVFGFFIDGVNVALLPGTTTPVSINNVNGGANASFFNNNDPSDGPPAFNIQYDGFTDVLSVAATGLSGGTHHLKLAIADAGDFILDSGVFIEAGSLSDVPTTAVPEPGTLLLVGSAMAGLGLVRRFRK